MRAIAEEEAVADEGYRQKCQDESIGVQCHGSGKLPHPPDRYRRGGLPEKTAEILTQSQSELVPRAIGVSPVVSHPASRSPVL